MKIGHLESTPAVASTTGKSGSTAKKADGTPESSTEVTLSAEAAQEATPFDAEKVARIAQAIKDGKFTVNHEAIADKLIANAQELLGKVSH